MGFQQEILVNSHLIFLCSRPGRDSPRAFPVRVFGGAVTYASVPAYAGLSFYDPANANGVGSARRDVLLGGTYDFGVVKAHALVEKADGDPTGTIKLDTLDLMAGVTVPLADGALMASFVRHDDRGSLDRDANQLGAAYNYPLSRRTSIYAAFARIVNVNGATFHVGDATETGTGAQRRAANSPAYGLRMPLRLARNALDRKSVV